MTINKFHIFLSSCNIVLLLVLVLALSSCEDEYLYDPNYIGEGAANIEAEVTFYQSVSELSRADGEGDYENPVTGGTPGNEIGDVTSLEVLLYDLNGRLVKKYGKENFTFQFEKINEDTSSDAIPTESEGNNPHKAELKTGRATFTLKEVPFGKYRMYAVANMDNWEDYATEIDSEDGLKNILLTWKDNIADNNQMFGYFKLASTNSSDNKSSGFQGDDLIINNPNIKLHSWLKRVVSKVTVAFDGTKLKDGVEIFIKSVEIRDIPSEVFLGADNTIMSESKLVDKCQIMNYGKGEDYSDQWIGYVSKNHPINGFDQSVVNNTSLNSKQKLDLLHSETTNAFFFYENLQGNGKENTPSDKRQQVNDGHKELGVVSYPNGSDPNDIAWKDAKKYGTYIVVHAYYKSTNPNEGEGDIIYRFMLGKDIKLDYNAERNYHYKLTLCFNGWANDVDWHIDYRRPEQKLRFPHPFYISYLYGQSAMLPIEFDADKDVSIEEIEIMITSNNWYPDNAGAYAADLDYNQMQIPGPQDNNKFWLYLNSPITNYTGNGFLSVRKPENLIIVPNPTGGLQPNSNQSHFESTGQGHRVYTKEELVLSKIPVYEAETADEAHVAWEDGTYYVKLPIWTRARELMSLTGYTGNNPYTNYYRFAKVKLKVTLVDGSGNRTILEEMVNNNGETINEIDVQQVRRVVNPKGVWRSSGNTDEFHVVLKTLEDETATSFTPIKSDGPWRAYVLHDTEADENFENGFIKLTGNKYTTEATTTFSFNDTESPTIMTRNCIEGVGNSDIDFTIKFVKGRAPSPRYALIRVEYNNYTCYHLIFVRQGYEADDTFGDGNEWMTCNNISMDKVGIDPRDEGSLFKYGSWAGIPSSLNVNNKTPWVMIKPNDFAGNALGNASISLTNGNTQTFEEITESAGGFPSPSGMRVATLEDFLGKLTPEDQDNQTFPVKTGVGILYADGANETITVR